MEPVDLYITERTVVDSNGCWIWQKAKNAYGYGVCNLPDGQGGFKLWIVSRLAFKEFVGEIPNGKCICHKCDVPACCNPDHLFVGTKHENSIDMADKGRSPRGERNGMSKLKESDVVNIKKELRKGVKHQILADEYNVARSVISRINTGKRWGHI